jgi:hypothetical protein
MPSRAILQPFDMDSDISAIRTIDARTSLQSLQNEHRVEPSIYAGDRGKPPTVEYRPCISDLLCMCLKGDARQKQRLVNRSLLQYSYFPHSPCAFNSHQPPQSGPSKNVCPRYRPQRLVYASRNSGEWAFTAGWGWRGRRCGTG